MIEIASASVAYSLVIFLVCFVLMVLYFCECGRNRGEMPTSSGRMLMVVSVDGYTSKLLTRNEVPWPIKQGFCKGQLKISVTGKSEERTQCTEFRNCQIESTGDNESEVSQPDKIYARS